MIVDGRDSFYIFDAILRLVHLCRGGGDECGASKVDATIRDRTEMGLRIAIELGLIVGLGLLLLT